MKRLGIMLLLLAGLLTQAGAEETLLANYFDIKVGSSSGTEVCGRINLMSNRDAHHKRIPDSYRFEITDDPSGFFIIENQRDSESRLFGALKVSKQLPSAPGDLWEALAVFDADSKAALLAFCVATTVNAVCEPYNRRPYALRGYPRMAHRWWRPAFPRSPRRLPPPPASA